MGQLRDKMYQDLKLRGFINEEEYRIEILAAGRDFARSRWV